MSHSDPEDGSADVDLEQYRAPHVGTVESDVELTDGAHPIEDALDELDRDHGFTSDSSVTGERFAFRYETTDAYVREYLANAQTAVVRRARYELQQNNPDRFTDSWLDNQTIPELLETAERVADYYPLIQISIAHPNSDRNRFVIGDNGIGISIEECLSMEKMGLSPNHDNEDVSGNFGQGIVSVFPAVSRYGEAWFTTRDARTGVSYAQRMTIDGFDDMEGEREHAGTTWYIPAHASDVDIDLVDAVERYAEAMYVPVGCSVYDEDGDLAEQQEYTYTPLPEQLPDETPVIHYEDEHVEAITSPALASDGTVDPKRYLISYPIDSGYEEDTYAVPWPMTIRVKAEDGRVWRCRHSDADHSDLKPIEDLGYDRLDEDDQAEHVPKTKLDRAETTDESVLVDHGRSLRDDIDVVLPEPVDDRDRFRDNDSTFPAAVSQKLVCEFDARVAVLLDEIARDGFSVFYDKSPAERALLVEGLTNNGWTTVDVSASTDDVQQVAQTVYGVRLHYRTATQLAEMLRPVDHAPRDIVHPDRATVQNTRPLYEVLGEAGRDGTVYPAVNVSPDKAKLAWAIDEQNHVISVDDAGVYDELATAFGMEPLKTLSLRNIARKYDVDDSLAASLDRSDRSGSSSSRDYDLDAPTRDIKVRQCRSGDYLCERPAETVANQISSGTLPTSTRQIRDLLVIPETEVAGVPVGGDMTAGPIARTIVPNYVADYLRDIDNCHYVGDSTEIEPTVESIARTYGSENVETIPLDDYCVVDSGVLEDVTVPDTFSSTMAHIDDLGPETLVLVLGDAMASSVTTADETPVTREDRVAGLLETVSDDITCLSAEDQIDPATYDQLVVCDHETVAQTYHAWGAWYNASVSTPILRDPAESPDVYVHSNTVSGGPSLTAEIGRSLQTDDLVLDVLFPRDVFDRDAPEWDLIAGSNHHAIRYGRQRGDAAIDIMYELAEYGPDDTVFPSER